MFISVNFLTKKLNRAHVFFSLHKNYIVHLSSENTTAKLFLKMNIEYLNYILFLS